MSEARAPEWDQGMGLTWSGKWHVITGSNPANRYEETKCGAYVERFGSKYFPSHLWAIAEGKKHAPVCKKCVPPNSHEQVEALSKLIFDELHSNGFDYGSAARAVIEAGWEKR